jgi:UDP-N-acetyl-2-amino-2-deoxyglucuronate dehydrogenase
MSRLHFGIGIVGCGNISEIHAEAIINSKRGKLLAACSRTRPRLEAFCEKYGIPGFTSYEEFLACPGLDTVSICTPSGTHLDFGVQAAKAGKNVIVEKPVEVTVKRGRELIEICKKNGVKLAVIYQNRFTDEAADMKRQLDAGKIGTPVLASASVRWFRSQDYYTDSGWRGTLALDGGGVLINQSIHTIDLLQWLAGDVESVSAFMGTFTHAGIEAEDTVVACLKFRNGAIGVFEGSTSVTPPQNRRIEVNGSKGTALLDGDQFHLKLDDEQPKERNEEVEAAGAASPLSGMSVINHQRQFEQILNSFADGDEPVVSGEESLKSLAIVEAIYKAANEGRKVFVDEILNIQAS